MKNKLTLKIEEIDPPYDMTGKGDGRYYRVSAANKPEWPINIRLNDGTIGFGYCCTGYPKEEVVKNFINLAKKWLGRDEITKRRQRETEYREVEV